MEQGAPADKRFGSTLFWRVFAIINLVTVLWVLWVIWQLTPRSVVYDFVLRLPPTVSHRAASSTMPGEPPMQQPAGPSAGASAVPQREIAIQSGAPMKPLRLDTEIKLPRTQKGRDPQTSPVRQTAP